MLTGTVLLVTLAVTGAQEPDTIESCGALLPGGYKFTMNISATIDTGGDEPQFDGEFSFREGSGTTGLDKDELIPFVDCVTRLIK